MKLTDFDYNLPKELIAQKPVNPRDHSKLLILDKKTGHLKHDHFYNLLKYLDKDDVLVFNNTKVFPARMIGKRDGTGGKVEIFLLKKIIINYKQKNQIRLLPSVIPAKAGIQNINNGAVPLWIPDQVRNDKKKDFQEQPLKNKDEYWEVLIGNKKKQPGQKIIFSKSFNCEIIKKLDESVWLVRFNKVGEVLQRLVDKLGQVPLPPYIKSQIVNRDSRPSAEEGIPNHESRITKKDYQTVYAKYRGSVAAPTAGFHFTKKLLTKIKKAGIKTEFVTLHVGLGTFQPVKVDDITKHQIHVEWAGLDKNTAKRLNQAKAEGRRIVAVGTTTVRVLETFSTKNQKLKEPKSQTNSKLIPQKDWTKIFIYPGYKFKFVDALITNFHLPKSTLLMLVSAFSGRRKILKAYEEAIKKKYRFYSFGDAMLII